jgi:hypothetical protein
MKEILLPKSDRRYKPGSIKRDTKGRYRGHPDTVELKRMHLPPNAPPHIQLNPPLVAGIELARFLDKRKATK